MSRLALALLGCCGVLFGGCGGEAQETGPVGFSEARATEAPAIETHLNDDHFKRISLDDAKAIVRRAEHELDLDQYPLHADEVCGGKKCQAANAPCDIWEWPGVKLLCACEIEGYLFICR